MPKRPNCHALSNHKNAGYQRFGKAEKAKRRKGEQLSRAGQSVKAALAGNAPSRARRFRASLTASQGYALGVGETRWHCVDDHHENQNRPAASSLSG